MMTAPAAACGPGCTTCGRLESEVTALRARVEILTAWISGAYAVTGRELPAAVGENIPARPSLTLHQGGAA